ncbi:hypothetical protein [Morganella sp. GD04133]|uniref:hypothetical protein n=1 Tax=Morganella sp. GD04133 TaxID=2975435 RepID=UPI00244CC637|nr:hypothetical protein [Morganella sp. GD04133]MDH0356979.1 hypothetical protein [Morganella sp. GD04133]
MADVASLAVALHLNAASFKSEVADAFGTASAGSKKFSRDVGSDSARTANDLARVSDEAKRTGNSIAQMGNSGVRSGFAQLRTSLTNISVGANVAGSSILSAFIPALERAANDVDRLGSAVSNKRAQDIAAAESAVQMAQAQVKQAGSAKQAAQSQIQLAGRGGGQAGAGYCAG